MKLNQGDIIEVFGWVMLKGIATGKYKILKVRQVNGQDVYDFARPHGRKPLISHYAKDVDPWLRDSYYHPDINRIVKL